MNKSKLSRFQCALLGIEITPIDKSQLLTEISHGIALARTTIIVGHNLHSSYIFHTNSQFQAFYSDASIILTDGMPVLWDYHLSGGKNNSRLGSTDWLPDLRRVENLKSVLVIGSTPEANQGFQEWLTSILPHARVAGMPGSGWNQGKEEEAVALVRDFRPDLTLIGLGMPLQEEFGARLLLQAPELKALALVGGAIDQLSGAQSNAPRAIGKLGLEWCWRLATQPRRLAGRYLLEPWKLLGVARRPIG